MSAEAKRYLVIFVGAAIGLVASFLQMIEKLVMLQYKDAVLACNIDSVFSCSSVLNAWQSSVFGFPNALMCVVVFTIFLGVGLVGLTGGQITRGMRIGTQALALFMLAFGLWFLYQSTYVIGAICIFCVACMAGLLMVNAALWRLNFSRAPEGGNSIGKFMHKMTLQSLDLLLWVSLIVVVAVAIILQFYV
jgi:uncharacterized membrane protein